MNHNTTDTAWLHASSITLRFLFLLLLVSSAQSAEPHNFTAEPPIPSSSALRKQLVSVPPFWSGRQLPGDW